MANDLKPMLSKVLASGGDKKFYFAYGMGKRKDGKGDGELAVGSQKVKKAELEGELAACNEVHEGVCWVGKGPDSNGTVYFQGKGKKLSPMVVAKMALTAKRTTGFQYDFQVPSPEEEARAAKLGEGEGNEGLAAQSATTPATGKAEAATGNLEAVYQARVQALTDGLKKAISSGTAAGNEAKLRYSEAQLLSRKQDFSQAMALLDVVEEQIQKALADGGGAKKSEPTAPATDNGDPATEWKKKLAEWSPAIKAAMTAKGPNATDIAKLLAQATALSKPGGDMGQAIAKLTECHALATASGKGSEPALAAAAQSAAPPKATPEDPARHAWEQQFAALEPAYLKLMAANPPLGPQLSALMVYAKKQAATNDYAKAVAGLGQLKTLLVKAATTPAAAPPAPISIVKLGKARLAWHAARSHGVQEMARLKKAVDEQYGDIPEAKSAVAAAQQKLDNVFIEIHDKLTTQLDAVLVEKDAGKQRPLADVAKGTLAKFMKFVETDELMSLLDGNDVLTDTSITKPIQQALQGIVASLS